MSQSGPEKPGKLVSVVESHEKLVSSGSMNKSISIFFAHIFRFLEAANEREKYRKNCIYDTRNLNLS